MDIVDGERLLRPDATDIAQICSGGCFDAFVLPVQPQAPRVAPSGSGQPPRSLQKRTVHDIQALYEPLLSSQTRLLRVLPQDTSSSIPRVQLVVADLIATEGLRLVDTKEDIIYTALSYCWQTRNDETDGIIVCNDLILSQPANIIAAIKFHCVTLTTSYLWIDAICINQDDLKEKANQIGIMLDIYHKAAQVTAWLGDPDRSSDQAISCVHARDGILEVLDAQPLIQHTSQCLDGLRLLHDALLDFYDRPYWQRTWIRQETFAARKMVAVCGETQLEWLSFLKGAGMIRLMNRYLFSPSARSTISIPLRNMKVQILLREAQRNWKNRTESWPRPRDLLQLLMSSKWYGVTVESDTVYALLRMAGVPITTNDLYRPSFAFRIDYERTVEEVYRELSFLLLKRYDYPVWWNFYIKPVGEPTPSWVMHWRHSGCEDIEMINHDNFAKADRAVYESEHIARTARWRPPLASERSVRVHNEDHRVLVVPARALNYVAYLTNYSCSVDRFMELSGDPLDESPLGSASELIHYGLSPVEGQTIFSFSPEAKLERFDRTRHDRRIAVLGCALDWQFALVPARTRKGDLIIGITSELLPMAISPHQETHQNSFYQTPDLYENCPLEGDIKTFPQWFFRNKWCSNRLVMRDLRLLCLFVWGVLIGSVGLLIMLVGVTSQPKDLGQTYGGLAAIILGMIGIVLYFIPRIRYPYLEVIKPYIEIRNRNFAILDKITLEHDPNYNLVGPVMVRQGGPFVQNRRSPIQQPSDRAIDRPVQTFYIH